MELGSESKVDVADELTKLTECINECNDLENVLFLDVFTAEEKGDILKSLAPKVGLSSLVTNFCLFLIEENRIGLFPLIFKEVTVIEDDRRGFMRGTIEGVDNEISREDKARLTELLKEKLGKEAQLEYVQNGDLTAGFRVTVEDLQLDATIDNQLNKFKQSILGD